MTPEQYCRAKAVRVGSSAYYSLLFTAQEKREPVTALLAFFREVTGVRERCNERAVAHAKLDWWRNEVRSMFHGGGHHPVCKALGRHLPTYDLPEDAFQGFIGGVYEDLERSHYATFSELSLYCSEVPGRFGVTLAKVLGYQDADTSEYASTLGQAIYLTKILRGLRGNLNRGRVQVPLDEMRQHGVSVDDLMRGKTTEPMRGLFTHQAERAHSYYERAFGTLPEVDRFAQCPGIILGHLYRSLLGEIQRDHFRILEHRLKLTPLRKLWIAWRIGRRENQRAKAKSQIH
jgi:phytoene synthase